MFSESVIIGKSSLIFSNTPFYKIRLEERVDTIQYTLLSNQIHRMPYLIIEEKLVYYTPPIKGNHYFTNSYLQV